MENIKKLFKKDKILLMYRCGSYAFGTTNDQTSSYKITTYTIIQIDVHERVTTLGNYLFNGLIDVTSVTLPASIETISPTAFNNCVSIKTVRYFGFKEPKSCANAFSMTKNAIVQVPKDYEGDSFCGLPIERRKNES